MLVAVQQIELSNASRTQGWTFCPTCCCFCPHCSKEIWGMNTRLMEEADQAEEEDLHQDYRTACRRKTTNLARTRVCQTMSSMWGSLKTARRCVNTSWVAMSTAVRWSDARTVGHNQRCRVELTWVRMSQICWRTPVSLWCHMIFLHDASAHLKSTRTSTRHASTVPPHVNPAGQRSSRQLCGCQLRWTCEHTETSTRNIQC